MRSHCLCRRKLRAVVCQFGAMFFPDRVAGYREARRVLKPGGRFVFSVWDSLEHNPMTRCVVEAAAARYPQNPPRFLARTPHGHHDASVIRRELAEAGFDDPTVETVTLPSRAPSADYPAIGFCQGTPMRASRGPVAPMQWSSRRGRRRIAGVSRAAR